MGLPVVSVIVPTYNLAEYTAEALESIRSQTFTDFEVIVVDDGSTDSTIDVVQTFLSDTRFKLIEQANQGTAGARNTGIKHARGEWIAFLDCDDLWLPTKLERQVDITKAHPDVGLVFGNGIEFTEDGDFGPFYRKLEVFPEGAGFERLLRGNCFWACSVMVRRQDVIDAGFLRTDLPGVDDYDLWLKMLERGGVARGVWEPVARYRKRRDSQATNKAVMFELLLRVYEDASTRLARREQRLALEGVARVRSDLLMVKARHAFEETGKPSHAYLTLFYRAWRQYPRRTKPLILLALSIIGRSDSVAEALARRW